MHPLTDRSDDPQTIKSEIHSTTHLRHLSRTNAKNSRISRLEYRTHWSPRPADLPELPGPNPITPGPSPSHPALRPPHSSCPPILLPSNSVAPFPFLRIRLPSLLTPRPSPLLPCVPRIPWLPSSLPSELRFVQSVQFVVAAPSLRTPHSEFPTPPEPQSGRQRSINHGTHGRRPRMPEGHAFLECGGRAKRRHRFGSPAETHSHRPSTRQRCACGVRRPANECVPPPKPTTQPPATAHLMPTPQKDAEPI